MGESSVRPRDDLCLSAPACERCRLWLRILQATIDDVLLANLEIVKILLPRRIRPAAFVQSKLNQ